MSVRTCTQNDRWWTCKVAGEYLGFSSDTVCKLWALGYLAYYLPFPGNDRFRRTTREACDEYLERMKNDPDFRRETARRNIPLHEHTFRYRYGKVNNSNNATTALQ